jgi:hypothetical protein
MRETCEAEHWERGVEIHKRRQSGERPAGNIRQAGAGPEAPWPWIPCSFAMDRPCMGK